MTKQGKERFHSFTDYWQRQKRVPIQNYCYTSFKIRPKLLPSFSIYDRV